MHIKTIAIDDEPLALKLLQDYISKTPFLDLVGSFDNPMDAIDHLSETTVDLIFLDIQMPDLTGIEFAKTLSHAPKLIFTTAYDKYALDGFKLNAVDYLLKPFNYQEFLTATNKAKKQIDLERKASNVAAPDEQYLFLKSEYKIKRINLEHINYIEGMKDYIKVYLDNEEKPILSLMSLKQLALKLPESKFMRVHRSFIVNLDKVHTIERGRIVFGKTWIAVSEQYKDKFQEFVQKNFL